MFSENNNIVKRLLSGISPLWSCASRCTCARTAVDEAVSTLPYYEHSMRRVLEPRIMLDAALMGIIAETLLPDDGVDYLQNNHVFQDVSTNSEHVLNELFENYIPPNISSEKSQNIVVFVDEGVDDLANLLMEFKDDVDVVIIDSDSDGLEQIAENLSSRAQIDAIHIFSHGAAGELELGNIVLNSNNIDQHSNTLGIIRDSLSDEADLLLYGCNFAQDQTFIADLALITGADIAASDDLTGSSHLGGDWVLEVKLGDINTEAFAFVNYNNVLAALTVSDFEGSITYDETDVNTEPQIIDAAVTLAGGTGVFSTYAITVLSNGEATERLSVNTQGYGIGEIAYNSGTGEVKYEGTLIGNMVSDGLDGSDLIIAFTDNANNTSVEALIENLTYENTSDDPVGARTVTIDINDGGIGNLVLSDTQSTGYYPESLTFSLDGNYAYIASSAYDTIEIYSHNSITGQLTFLSQVKDGVDGVDGLDGVLNTTFSSDGNYFYAAGYNDDAVAIFSYDNTTGQLTYLSQVKDGVGGVDGLDGARNITFSPDGNYAYVTGTNDNAVAIFSYDNTTGSLTYLSNVRDGVGGVDGLYGAIDIIFSPDGNYAYVTGCNDDSVAIFSYDNTTGSLTYLSRVRDGSGGVDGLNGATQLTFSPDGNYAYVTGCNDNAVAIFSYDNTTGSLTYLSNVRDGVGGVDGLYGAMDIIFSPDGSYAYVTGYNDDAVAVFSYDNTTGNLTQIGFFKDGTVAGQETVSGLNAVTSLTLSQDGKFMYAAGYYDHAVSIFKIEAVLGENNVEFSKTVNITPVDDVLVFNDQTLYATEDMQVTDSVGTVQLVDPDGPAPTYTIMGGNADGIFAINAITGEITIADTTNLDFEITSQYVLTVDVTDGTNLDTASITININDVSEAGFLVDLTQEVVFLENTLNSSAQIIDGNVTLSGGPANYDGYVLLIGGTDYDDRFNIKNIGSGAGQIGVSGINVLYEGIVIGLTSSANTKDMNVSLNASASATATEALIEALTYQNSDQTPVLTRDVNITLMSSGLVSGDPFDGVTVGYNSTPTFADIDGDGDIDAFIGESSGNINYYENDGSGNFTEITGAGNPFDGVDIGSNSVLAFADIDGDGDLDAFIGESSGNINYYENDGNGNFTSITGAGNPFDGVDVGSDSTVAFADIDGDGDLDAFIGEWNGNINYYENDGSGNFTEITDAGNPFDGVSLPYASALAFADIDGDGDLDAFIGHFWGGNRYYENDGSGNFTQIYGSGNPFDGVRVGYYYFPSFADIDGDGDLDAFIGESNGSINYYENDGNGNFAPFAFYTITAAITDDVGSYSAPTLADIDGDGDLDAFIGENGGTIKYYENDGVGNFTEITDAGNPFDGVDVGSRSTPTFADIDGDGDLDAFIGESSGTIKYYENDGSGSFTEITGAGNPFDGVDVGHWSSPTFADIDGDGDLDAFIGEYYGMIKYYENDGAGNFIEITDAGNPFNGIDVGTSSELSFYDYDGDGDLDAFIGESGGTIKYLQNNGNMTFTILNGPVHAFDGLDVGSYSIMTLGDIDGDGDLDALIGSSSGLITSVIDIQEPVSSTSYGAQITINIVAEDDIPTDLNMTSGGTVFESAVNGTFVAQFSCTDSDSGSAIYSLHDDSSGRFVIDSVTGELTLADTSLVDYEQDLSYQVIVRVSNDEGQFYDESFQIVTINDGSDDIIVNIDVNSFIFDEQDVNASPQLLDVNVTITNAPADFTGYQILIGTSENIDDQLSFRDVGNGAGQLAFDGVDVSYEGIIIGTLSSNGVGGDPLIVNLNANATLAGVEAVFENVTYANNSDFPAQQRNITMTLANGNYTYGASSSISNIDIGSRSTPTFADIDGDGDLDAFIGESSGNINYYENDGSGNFTEITGIANPFNGVDVGSYSAIAFADIDGDGDLDAFIGESNGTIKYYENDGSGNFTEITGVGNPFNGVDVGNYSSLAFADIDGDGDLDAFIGNSNGTINYYENDGSGNFTNITGAGNPFDGVDVGSYSTPTFADINGDGNIDAFIGNSYGNIKYYENDGSGNFTSITGAGNPFDGVDVGSYSTPTFADINGDGNIDAFIGESYGTIFHYINNAGTFIKATANSNLFNGVDIGSYSTPIFADIDGDGDLDAFIGESNGNINYYENTDNNFVGLTGIGNPFNGVDVGSYSSLAFADIDGDGDLDAFIGELYGTIKYYENDGAGNFTEIIGAGNPFDGVSVGIYSALTFADIDGDGDLDAFIGSYYGTIYYYENDGSGNFTNITGAGNPFNGVDVGYRAVPTFADIDGDGDLDAIIGSDDQNIFYYENDGSGNFTNKTGIENPFGTLSGFSRLSPSFYDSNGDGLLDLFYGESNGTIVFAQGHFVGSQGDVISISITTVDEVFSFTGLDASITLAENDVNATLQIIDSDIQILNDFTDFNGFELHISTTGGIEDQLSILALGTGPNQFDISGANLRFNGTTVGNILSDGTNGSDFIVQFNNQANNRIVQAAMHNVAYGNSSDMPSAARDVTFTLTDGASFTDAHTITVNVTTENDLPVFNDVTYSIAENDSVSTLVGTVSATGDPDGPVAPTYTITAGNGDGVFGVDNVSGVITLIDVNSLDFETTPQYVLTVEADDGAGQITAQVTINVTDIFEPLLIGNFDSPAAFAENTVNAGGVIIDSDISLANPDNIVNFDSYNLFMTTDGGIDNQLSIRNQGNGVGQIGFDGSFVTYGGVTIGSILSAGDNGNPLTVDLNATATDLVIKALMENITYSNSSNIPVANRNVTFEITDGVDSAAVSATISITQENDAPNALFLSNNAVDEAEENATTIGIFTTIDPDVVDVCTYDLIDNAGGRFSIDTINGNLLVADSVALDFEVLSSHTITVRVTDSSGAYFESLFTININDIEEALPDSESNGNIIIDSDGAGFLKSNNPVEIDKVGNVTEDFVYHNMIKDYLYSSSIESSSSLNMEHIISLHKFNMVFPDVLKDGYNYQNKLEFESFFEGEDGVLLQNRIIDFDQILNPDIEWNIFDNDNDNEKEKDSSISTDDKDLLNSIENGDVYGGLKNQLLIENARILKKLEAFIN